MRWCLVPYMCARKTKPADGPQCFADLRIALHAQTVLLDLARTSSGWEGFWWINVFQLRGKKKKKHSMSFPKGAGCRMLAAAVLLHWAGGECRASPGVCEPPRPPGRRVNWWLSMEMGRRWSESSPRRICRWKRPGEAGEGASGPFQQPRGTCKLWEFKEQHIPKTSCSLSFLIEKKTHP